MNVFTSSKLSLCGLFGMALLAIALFQATPNAKAQDHEGFPGMQFQQPPFQPQQPSLPRSPSKGGGRLPGGGGGFPGIQPPIQLPPGIGGPQFPIGPGQNVPFQGQPRSLGGVLPPR